MIVRGADDQSQPQPFAYYNRASLYETLGDKRAAIIDLEKCLAYGPDDALSAKIKDSVAQLRRNT